MNAAVVGCGVRGSIVAALLAGADVEQLYLVDGGFVEPEDIAAGPLQFRPDLRASKPDALVAKIALLNSSVHAQAFPAHLDAENALAILAGADVVIDCVSDPVASEAIADAAEELGISRFAPPEGFDSDSVSSAEAVAVAAEQAAAALAGR